ncbi:hypothetical protein G0Q06_00655 [Puniceicoccales bacterium CK1056]|uniref:Chalcone isomerase domain-containing protein n=1 Tax=Oceanipulchritudo coccoides TaxID=2706888 RepID=A0A6B2LYG6_9BACT|nr:chalcone isomerase family protein [Oceanipulchritudo coccoides]NDV60954.1 hypothetical protein [Oceanipulchritudo coccoides]
MKRRQISLLLLAMLPFVAEAKTFQFPQNISEASVELQKVGQGSFRWMFFKVYEGAFYQDSGNLEASALDDVAKCLELQYNVRITADQFRESGDSILKRNLDDTTWQNIRDRLARLNEAYQDVEKGDRYALVYTPGNGTTLKLNGEPLVTVEGADFAKAYFSIWLGEDAVKASFRKALLSN